MKKASLHLTLVVLTFLLGGSIIQAARVPTEPGNKPCRARGNAYADTIPTEPACSVKNIVVHPGDRLIGDKI